jgi:hypothetical protein
MNLDLKTIQSTALARLPERTRWLIKGVPLDIDFSTARRGLARVGGQHVIGGTPPPQWRKLLIFGEYDYAEGGGAAAWICVREGDGAICGLDPERGEQPVFLFNSSIDRFIDTFLLLDLHLRSARALPDGIVAAARDLDGDAYDASEWRVLINHISGQQ